MRSDSYFPARHFGSCETRLAGKEPGETSARITFCRTVGWVRAPPGEPGLVGVECSAAKRCREGMRAVDSGITGPPGPLIGDRGFDPQTTRCQRPYGSGPIRLVGRWQEKCRAACSGTLRYPVVVRVRRPMCRNPSDSPPLCFHWPDPVGMAAILDMTHLTVVRFQQNWHPGTAIFSSRPALLSSASLRRRAAAPSKWVSALRLNTRKRIFVEE